MSTLSTDDQPPSGCDRFRRLLLCLILGLFVVVSPLRAETGYDAWLRYHSIDDKSAKDRYAGLPAIVVKLEDSDLIKSAGEELVRGVQRMLGRTLRIESKLPKEGAILLGTFDAVKKAAPSIEKMPQLVADGFWLKTI